jgi:hypothetical protein
MLGKLARPVLRRADGKGPRERHLVSRLSYLEHPFENLAVSNTLMFLFNPFLSEIPGMA